MMGEIRTLALKFGISDIPSNRTIPETSGFGREYVFSRNP